MAILESVEAPELAAGLPVEVRNRFTQSWSGGFEISEIVAAPVEHSYRIRRLSDGSVLPDVFPGDAVRRCA